MTVTIELEVPKQPEVVALIELSDEYMASLYPPEGNFAVDLDALSAPDISFLVARLDGKAVGCGAIKWFDDGSAELKRIFVHDDARGHGIGRKIMAALQALAEERGVFRLYLETGPLNVEAVGLYEALGYQHCGPFADYEENPHSLFMVKELKLAGAGE
ncbi:GNAT family N-acetyltransferase [Agrobacterium tumefaciens]|uniref:GNAT family N-acetyltransferase n=1 Tax=Agrobacterium tumefaciens TaxID=358 RepID=UPI00287C4489|nr:GNAT family N-acetyltransferase [Agrobacterium tumefaciens]MDS7597802.1 GNAT family N-acetyltransferase [Agrobacterium tumefaciens]